MSSFQASRLHHRFFPQEPTVEDQRSRLEKKAMKGY